jgi:hypothetical protein
MAEEEHQSKVQAESEVQNPVNQDVLQDEQQVPATSNAEEETKQGLKTTEDGQLANNGGIK